MEPTNNNKYSSDPIIKSVELEAELYQFFNQFENLDIPLYWSETHNFKHSVKDKKGKTEKIGSVKKYPYSLLNDFFNMRLKKEMEEGKVIDKHQFIDYEIVYLEKFENNTFENHLALDSYKRLLNTKRTEKNKRKKEYKEFYEFFNPEFKENSQEIIKILQENYYNETSQKLAGMIIGLYDIGILKDDPTTNQTNYVQSLVGGFTHKPKDQIRHDIRDYYNENVFSRLQDSIEKIKLDLENLLKPYL